MKYVNRRLFKKIKKSLNKKGPGFLLIFLFFIASFLLGILFDRLTSLKVSETKTSQTQATLDLTSLQNKVLKKNYVFNIRWGDLGKRMVEDGVIDKIKLAQAIGGRDELDGDLDKYFSTGQNKIELTQSNSQFWVDVLWGLGLANKSKILEEGQMMQGGDASNFASTGGWTLGVSNSMDYYSKYSYINLSDKQQEIVEEIAGSIYRPCCDNPTSFPDCNHGMAALGLIELMVSQGFSEDEIYKTVLAFNTFWFPQTYLNTAYYFEKNGRSWEDLSAKEILSKTFSSASGSQVITQKVGTLNWPLNQGGGSCGA